MLLPRLVHPVNKLWQVCRRFEYPCHCKLFMAIHSTACKAANASTEASFSELRSVVLWTPTRIYNSLSGGGRVCPSKILSHRITRTFGIMKSTVSEQTKFSALRKVLFKVTVAWTPRKNPVQKLQIWEYFNLIMPGVIGKHLSSYLKYMLGIYAITNNEKLTCYAKT